MYHIASNKPFIWKTWGQVSISIFKRSMLIACVSGMVYMLWIMIEGISPRDYRIIGDFVFPWIYSFRWGCLILMGSELLTRITVWIIKRNSISQEYELFRLINASFISYIIIWLMWQEPAWNMVSLRQNICNLLIPSVLHIIILAWQVWNERQRTSESVEILLGQ